MWLFCLSLFVCLFLFASPTAQARVVAVVSLPAEKRSIELTSSCSSEREKHFANQSLSSSSDCGMCHDKQFTIERGVLCGGDLFHVDIDEISHVLLVKRLHVLDKEHLKRVRVHSASLRDCCELLSIAWIGCVCGEPK